MSDVLDAPEGLVRPGKFGRWGNSAAVRLTTDTLESARMGPDEAVEIVSREGEIVIRRPRPKVTMAELLARFDPARHRHALQFDGAPAGTETR